MRLRNAVGAAVGALGATALANRVLASRADPFEPMLPGESGTYRWRGFDIAYTEAGDPEAQDLVLLHGINAAGSSHEFDPVFEQLAEEYHVLAPDLPGFGHSDRPPLTYSASLYETFVRDFLADTSDDPLVVASSLTGAYVAAVADDVEASGYALVCPTADTVPGRRTWLRTLYRSPVLGETIHNVVVSKPSIRYFHDDHGYYDTGNLPDEVVDYEWRSGHQPGARFAPASFISGFLDAEIDLKAALAAIDVPVTLVWGTEATLPPLSTGRDLAEAADVTLVSVGESMHLPHVEHPDEFLDALFDDAFADVRASD